VSFPVLAARREEADCQWVKGARREEADCHGKVVAVTEKEHNKLLKTCMSTPKVAKMRTVMK